jgi:hypothetical protein
MDQPTGIFIDRWSLCRGTIQLIWWFTVKLIMTEEGSTESRLGIGVGNLCVLVDAAGLLFLLHMTKC